MEIDSENMIEINKRHGVHIILESMNDIAEKVLKGDDCHIHILSLTKHRM